MASARGSCRVGADIGGTFTDVALDHAGRLHSTKILTDYAAPERAIVAGLMTVLAEAGLMPADVDLLIHGTTLATNALIERRGARTAFITTDGFRDVIEMRTENRFEQYDLNITLPPPLIERKDRFVLAERMSAAGAVLLAPTAAAIEALAETVVAGDYASVAVGFIHAYANPAHERLMREALLARRPALSVSISSEVSPQIREFERFNTVCANAYVRPAIEAYLDRLVASLRDIGMAGPVAMIHSGGGIVSVATAAQFPVRLVESGPAGGAIFAAHIARQYDLPAVLSFDMGGTTAKICLIENQVPKTAKTFEVARTYRFRKGSGMPISIPVVEMVEIGAGGGSIAGVDALRQIRVGPRSAGSEPGPACYGRGGTHATVTDANLLLGRLDPGNFAGGSIPLLPDAASRALQADVGEPLRLAAADAAYGVCEVVDETMANAGRVHAVENGKDLGHFTMITFGGGGPLHAARLCEKMGIARFLVPPGAGVGSAIGFLRAPFGYEAVRSAAHPLSGFDPAAARALVTAMTDEALSFVRDGLAGRTPIVGLTLSMRYVGQGWDIPVEVDGDIGLHDGPSLTSLYEAAYARFFGRPIEGLDIEIVSWSVRARSPLPPVERIALIGARRSVAPRLSRAVFDAGQRGVVPTAIVERDALAAGDQVEGPAIIAERETSTLVPAAFAAIVQPDGCLLVARR